MLNRFKNGWIPKALLVLLGFALLASVELGLRLSGFGDEYEFVIESPEHPGKRSLNSQYIALHYFHHLPIRLGTLFRKDPWFPDTQYSAKKPPGTYRIFLVGASTTRGFPFSSRDTSYSGFLRKILADVLPDHPVEIINAGYDAISSFGVLDVTRQLIDQEPDLIIVYSGHNEFIGHFGVNSNFGFASNPTVVDWIIKLHQSKIFLLEELLVLKLKSFKKEKASGENSVNLFKVMLNDKNFSWDREGHEKSEKNFANNIRHIGELGQDHQVPIIFSTLVSNLSDFSPVQSSFDPQTTEDSQKAYFVSFKGGQEAFKANRLKEASALYGKAVQLDPTYAQGHYEFGKVLVKQSNFPEARKEFLLAREMDRVHLRACLKFNRIIRSMDNGKDLRVIKMGDEFERASKNRLIGNNLFLEHVHPNINGHLLMANEIAHFLSDNNYIEAKKDWHWEKVRKAADYVGESGFNKKEYVNSQTTVGRLLLDFPFFKCDEGVAILKTVNAERGESKMIQQCREIEEQDIDH